MDYTMGNWELSTDYLDPIVTFDFEPVFNSSTQATERLKELQTRMPELKGKVKGLINDVVTRWWSTHAMIERLLELKEALDFIGQRKEFKNMEPLDEQDWQVLVHITDVLKPFKDAQKLLEGQKYVTAGFVLQAVQLIRSKLRAKSEDPRDTGAKKLAQKLLKDHEERWGLATDPVWNENVRRGALNRQVGIHPMLLVATFLDPRFKTLHSISRDDDKQAIT